MFTAAERDRLLGDLIAHAQTEPDVTAAALVGSAARGQTDRWSDIDLALRLAPDADPAAVAGRWTVLLGERAEMAHHLDVWSGPVLYRVFLLTDSLQVDLSFWPAEEFASTGEPFTLLFGTANPPQVPAAPDLVSTVGWAWLYALHTRSALARGRRWQAVQMLNGLRDQTITITCARSGLPGHQGRGVDQLSPALKARFTATLVGHPEAAELVPAFAAAVTLLLEQVEAMDPSLAGRLRAPLTAMIGPRE